jgi:collagenase-like PrtC family protease
MKLKKIQEWGFDAKNLPQYSHNILATVDAVYIGKSQFNTFGRSLLLLQWGNREEAATLHFDANGHVDTGFLGSSCVFK